MVDCELVCMLGVEWWLCLLEVIFWCVFVGDLLFGLEIGMEVVWMWGGCELWWFLMVGEELWGIWLVEFYDCFVGKYCWEGELDMCNCCCLIVVGWGVVGVLFRGLLWV